MTPERKAVLKRAVYPMPERERISHRGLLDKYRTRSVATREERPVKH